MNNFTPESNLFQVTPPCDVPNLRDREIVGVGTCRGLSLNKQSYKRKNRYSVFYNSVTGKVFYIDLIKARYDRLRARIHNWAELIDSIPGHKRMVMVTLTYKPSENWRPDDIRDFMSKVKRKLGPGLLAYAWVSEIQDRGALHYHVALYMRKGTRFPLPDKAGLWKHGSSNVKSAKSPFYLVSYTKKQDQKDYMRFPDGARAFAVWISGDVLSKKLRLLSLKPLERSIVDIWGFDGLKIWRSERVASPWHYAGVYKEQEQAELRTAFILDVFESYKMCGIGLSMDIKII